MNDTSCEHSLELSNPNSSLESDIALAYVEIDDQGSLRNRQQLNNVKSLIRLRGGAQLKAGKPHVVFLFVHGWKHNASPDDDNVRAFREALQQYSNINADARVTGVYVGWRGLSTKAPLMKMLSFWARKRVSVEVGSGALVDVLATVENSAVDTESMMISIGHSFGGSALFNATRQILLSRLDSPPKRPAEEPFPYQAGVGDLLLIINPAFEAMQYWPLHSAMRGKIAEFVEAGGVVPKGMPPRLVIYQSQADKATRYAFPAARLLPVYLLESYTKNTESTNESDGLSQLSMDRFGIGHYCKLTTHSLININRKSSDGKSYYDNSCVKPELINESTIRNLLDKRKLDAGCGTQPHLSEFRDYQWTSPTTGLTLLARDAHIQGSPFWVVYDTIQSIKHNDFEDPDLQCLFADLIAEYSANYNKRVARKAYMRSSK